LLSAAGTDTQVIFPMSGRRIRLTIAVYGLLGLAAVVWGVVRGNANIYHHPEPWWQLPAPLSTAVAIAAGLAVAGTVVLLTPVLVRRTAWARDLHIQFRHLLTPLTKAEIAAFALTSGIGEELFFRGALQPSVGLLASGVIFGLVHVGPNRHFLPWTMWAILMGWVFGALYQFTGELVGPIAAHALINYKNLQFIERHDPRPRDGARPERANLSD